MVEYYFDTETTGINFDKDEIITIQYQKLDGFTGKPIDKLNILKSWDSSEEDILKKFLPNLKCNPFDFIFVGKNLLFDFGILNERLKHYGLGGIDLRRFHERVSIDIKPILVLMNGGNFKGYDKVIPKTNPTSNDLCPKLYQEARYDEIIKYIENEARDFVRAYQIMKKEIQPIRRYLQ